MSVYSVALFSALFTPILSRVSETLFLALFALCLVGVFSVELEARLGERRNRRVSNERERRALQLLFVVGSAVFGVAYGACLGAFASANARGDASEASQVAVEERRFEVNESPASTRVVYIPNASEGVVVKKTAYAVAGQSATSRAYAPDPQPRQNNLDKQKNAASFDGSVPGEEVAPAPLTAAKPGLANGALESRYVPNASAATSRAYSPEGSAISGAIQKPISSKSSSSTAKRSVISHFSPDVEQALLDFCFADGATDNPITPAGFSDKDYSATANQIGVSETSIGVAGQRRNELLNRLDEEKARVSKEVRSAVLTINVKKRVKSKTEEIHGSGFAVQYASRVFIVTNQHVVESAESCRDVSILTYEGQLFQPTRIFQCPDFDVAALELDPKTISSLDSLRLCRLADSSELESGFGVFTIGAPLFMDWTMTYCHVGKLYRDVAELKEAGIIKNAPENRDKDLVRYIQISGVILEGNSGGPLFNAQGDVVGMVTATIQQDSCSTGIGFAIPIEDALSVIRNMVDSGSWSRSYLGVVLDDSRGSVFTRNNGVELKEVKQNSPAEAAGVKVGDRIRAFNGELVNNKYDLARLIALTKPGEEGNMEIIRDGRAISLTFTTCSGAAVARSSESTLRR